MSSMTDLVFLLLVFFMITSTMVTPNAIKVLLPQGKQQTSAKPLARVIIDQDLNYYTAFCTTTIATVLLGMSTTAFASSYSTLSTSIGCNVSPFLNSRSVPFCSRTETLGTVLFVRVEKL